MAGNVPRGKQGITGHIIARARYFTKEKSANVSVFVNTCFILQMFEYTKATNFHIFFFTNVPLD